MQAGQALIKAIGWREWEEAKQIVTDDTMGEVMSYIDNEGRNPLHRACSRGAPTDLMDVILSVCNEDILLSQDNNGLTPLHWAVSSSVDEAMIAMVIEACPQATTVTDKAGRTPHDLAKGRKKSPAILQQLEDASKIDELQSKGNAALMEGDTTKAIRYYSRCLDKYGANGVIYSNRSAAYLIDGDIQNALDDAERCLELLPNSVEGYLRKGSALRAYGMYEEAAVAFRDGIERCPDDPDLLSSLSELENDMEHGCHDGHSAEMTLDSQEFSCEVNHSEAQETIDGDVAVDTQMYTTEMERLQDEVVNMGEDNHLNMNDMHIKLEEMEKKYEAEMEQRLIELEKKHEAELDEVRREAQESGNNRDGELEQMKRDAEEVANGYAMEIEDIKREAEEALQLQENEMMAEIDNLRNEVQALKDKNAELETSITKVKEIKENQEAGTEAEIKDLNEQIDELRQQVEMLKNERKSHNKELEALKQSTSTQISKLRIDVEVLGEEKDTLEMDLTDAQMKLASQEEKNEEMKKTIDTIIAKAEESVKVQQAWVDNLRNYGGKPTNDILSPKTSMRNGTDSVKTPLPKSRPRKDTTPKANNPLTPDCKTPTIPSPANTYPEEENDENDTRNVETIETDNKVEPKVELKTDIKSKIDKRDTVSASSPKLNDSAPSFRSPPNAPSSVRGRTTKIANSSARGHSFRSASPMRVPSPSPLRGPRGPSPRVGVVTRPR